MFNTGSLKLRWMTIIVASALAALAGSESRAGEPQLSHDPPSGSKVETASKVDKGKANRPPRAGESEKATLAGEGYEQIAENVFGDGRTIRILRVPQSSTANDEADETIEVRCVLPSGRIITIRLPDGKSPSNAESVIHVEKEYRSAASQEQTAKEAAAIGRFQVSPLGDSAILVDTETGKTWLLYYPNKNLHPRANEARGNSWKGMPCIWLPLHRPETDAEIEQILERERSIREVSDKLRAEERKQAEEEARQRAKEFEERAERRRRARSSGGDSFPLDPDDDRAPQIPRE